MWILSKVMNLLKSFVTISSEVRRNNLFDKPFTMNEFIGTISKTDTSPGPDFIRYSILSSLPVSAKEMLLEIYNNIYELGIVPDTWRNFEVVPILKPGKDPKLASAYGPIAKGSCVRKNFESMLKKPA